MKQTGTDVNRMVLHGRVAQPPALSHCNHEVEFFTFPLAVSRLSGVADQVNVVASRALLEGCGWLERGEEVTVHGEVRTFNNRSGVGSRLIISVFAKELLLEQGEDENRLLLSGTLCKPPSLRSTPLGRTICDMILAVNRRYGRAGLSPLHHLGQSGPPVRRDGGGEHPVLRRPSPEPYLYQEPGGPDGGAGSL